MLGRILLVIIVVAAMIWPGDWLVLRVKMSRDAAYGDVEVRHRYAVKLKNRRIEQRSEKAHMQECVRSLFPHYGDQPCWYVARHAFDEEEIDSGAWHFYNQ